METDRIWDFSLARAKFGIGAVEEVGYDIRMLGGNRVLLVTDKTIVQAGLVDKVLNHLKTQNLEVEVWDGVEPEPTIGSYEVGIEAARKFKPDSFIGLGGGSAIDTMKVINLIYTYGGEILDYVAPPTGKGKPTPGLLKPQIAIPTTSGTGSETSPASVITLPEQRLKVGISHLFQKPHLAILDPEMTVTCPPSVTASAGMDALSHAIGAYTCRRSITRLKPKTPLERPAYAGGTELTDIFAIKAIKLIGQYLRRAVYNGLDIEARAKMQLASFYAGVAFTNAGVIPDHAIAYPVGGEFHTPHGLTVAVLLPAVMEFCLPTNYYKFAHIAKLLGENVENLTLKEAAYKSVEAVKQLSKDIGIPSGLEALNVKEEDIPRLARDTLKVQRLLAMAPRPIKEEDIKHILKAALRNY
jgi:alcohol dehydrogenase class IV